MIINTQRVRMNDGLREVCHPLGRNRDLSMGHGIICVVLVIVWGSGRFAAPEALLGILNRLQ